MLKALKNKTNGILNYSDYKKPGYSILYFVLVFILVVAVLTAVTPVLWLILSSFKDASELTSVPYRLFPENFSLKKIGEVWQMLDFGKYFLNTIVVAIGAVLFSVVFNGLLAYAFSIVKPKGYRIFYGLVMLSYMIPTVTAIVPLFSNIVALNMINSYAPLMLCYGANAYYLLMFKNYFDSLPPSLFEASRCPAR